MKQQIILIFIFIVLVVSTYLTFFDYNKLEISLSVDNVSECSDMDVSHTAKCMRNYVKEFYNYIERADFVKTLNDIKKYGGDCYDYSIFYRNMAREFGFKSKLVKINGKDNGHTFAIMWDNELNQYCKLDLLDVDCLSFEEDEN